MVVTDDASVAATIRLARSQGAAGKYCHTQLGFNYRMTDLAAALGLSQLGRLEDYLARRRQNAAVLSEGLAGLEGVLTPVAARHAAHTYNQYSILVGWNGGALSRDELAAGLAARGVESAVHYPRPLHRQPMFSTEASGLEVSERLARHILSLPVHPGVSPAEAGRVAITVADVISLSRTS